MRKILLISGILLLLLSLGVVALFISGLGPLGRKGAERPEIDRTSKIPATADKVTPATDIYPPVLHSSEYEEPVPLSDSINTAGAEDSPFIAADGTLYFWFTPDVSVPAERQLLDGVTGIYSAAKADGDWADPKRVYLQDTDKQALDGCPFVLGNVMWFCSSRTGYTGIHWFTAELSAGKWNNWQNADFDSSYEVGELHISSNGRELYFHSARPGGKGGLDLWLSRGRTGGIWEAPQNLSILNSAEDDSRPFLTADGGELWFTRTYKGTPAVYRSKKVGESWALPELIVSQFAGEPTLDAQGNLYFVHHFFKDGKMIEADIYIAKKK